jgi:hypothetical protein
MTGQADAAFESSVRTSKTGWLSRTSSDMMERVFRRAGDVLNLDHEILRPERNAELLQVVHYGI